MTETYEEKYGITKKQQINIVINPEKLDKVVALDISYNYRKLIILPVIMIPLSIILTYIILGKTAFGEEGRIVKSIGIGLFIVAPLLWYLSVFINKKITTGKIKKIADEGGPPEIPQVKVGGVLDGVPQFSELSTEELISFFSNNS